MENHFPCSNKQNYYFLAAITYQVSLLWFLCIFRVLSKRAFVQFKCVLKIAWELFLKNTETKTADCRFKRVPRWSVYTFHALRICVSLRCCGLDSIRNFPTEGSSSPQSLYFAQTININKLFHIFYCHKWDVRGQLHFKVTNYM